MKLILQLTDKHHIFNEFDETTIIWNQQTYNFDQVAVNKSIQLDFSASDDRNQKYTICYYTNFLSAKQQASLITLLLQCTSPPFTIKIYQLNSTGQQQLTYNTSFKSKSDVILNLTNIPLHETSLIQINDVQVFSTIKLESLKTQEMSPVLNGLYQFVSDAKNEKFANKTYKLLPNYFIIHFKVVSQNSGNLQVFFGIFSRMKNHLKICKNQKTSNQTRENNSFINLDAIDAELSPNKRQSFNYQSPELQKQVNDNLILALNEAHQRIKELQEENDELTQERSAQPVSGKKEKQEQQKPQNDVQQSESLKTQEQQAQDSSQIFQQLKSKTPNLEISPVKLNTIEQKNPQKSIFQELQTSLNKSHRPSLVDLSQQPVDQELFDEYNVNDKDVQKSVEEKLNQSLHQTIKPFYVQKHIKEDKIDDELNQIIDQSPIQGTVQLSNKIYNKNVQNFHDSGVQTESTIFDRLKLEIPPGSSKQTLLQSILNVTNEINTVLTSPMKSVGIGVRYNQDDNDIELFEIKETKGDQKIPISPLQRSTIQDISSKLLKSRSETQNGEEIIKKIADMKKKTEQKAQQTENMVEDRKIIVNYNQNHQEKQMKNETQKEIIELNKISPIQKSKRVFSSFVAESATQAKPVETKTITEQEDSKLLENVDKKSYLYLQNIQTILQKHKQAVNQANSQLKQHNNLIEQKKKQASFVEEQSTQHEQKNEQVSSSSANFIKFVQMNE